MNKRKGYWFAFGVALILCAMVGVYVIIDVPSSSGLASSEKGVRCLEYSSNQRIDVNKPLKLVVWNIYKQNRKGWDTQLSSLADRNALILLQEAQSTPQLRQQMDALGWHRNQAYAFAINDEIAGVMTLSKTIPKMACAYTKIEPYLRLPKSALYSEFALSNGETLSVINLHSINFTYGIAAYKEQLLALVEAVKTLKGPVIIAGDFNTWSKARLELVKGVLGDIGMSEALFSQDERMTVFGYPLDHLFYRNLQLNTAISTQTPASDHAWIEASFSFLLK